MCIGGVCGDLQAIDGGVTWADDPGALSNGGGGG